VNWFQQQRQEWIAETLRVFGYINREQAFQVLNPGTMVYDPREKCYRLAAGQALGKR
jgi:hypothetical protein